MVEAINEGEDAPITIEYTDADGNAIDPDAAPTLTITDPAGTNVVDAVAMTADGTGFYEHVWDSDVDGTGTGTYDIEITAEFSSETKINRDQIEVR